MHTRLHDIHVTKVPHSSSGGLVGLLESSPVDLGAVSESNLSPPLSGWMRDHSGVEVESCGRRIASTRSSLRNREDYTLYTAV